MHLLYAPFLLVLSLIAPSIQAGKTSLFIDRVPGYSSLGQCAQARVSAVVRAQASGCGDDMAMTSFSCFCIDSSSYFNSVLSTDVASNCQATAIATTTGAGQTLAGRQATTQATAQATANPEIASVLEVFQSYCSKTSELGQYQDQPTAIITITQAPPTTTASLSTSTSTSSPTSAPANSGEKKTTSVVVIAVPIVVGVLAIACGIVLFFWLRRRRAAKKEKVNPYMMPAIYGGELHGSDVKAPEVQNMGAVKYRYELENLEQPEPVEMDATAPVNKAGWKKSQA